MTQDHPAFDRFVETIAALRAPDGCPWDKEQTHRSIASNMIEEAYEAVDAIEADDIAHLREELGDVLLQVVLQSQIASDAGEFSIDEVCEEVNAKIVRRHPHVFGDARATDANEVLDLWDQTKLAERGSEKQGLLDGVPKSFPALMQAQKISRKAAAAGFDWDDVEGVWQKVDEEIDELKQAYARAPKSPNGKISKEDPILKEEAELELGDVLFSLVNVARKMGLDAEGALRAACDKFRHRWALMEERAEEGGTTLKEMGAPAREALWEQAKDAER